MCRPRPLLAAALAAAGALAPALAPPLAGAQATLRTAPSTPVAAAARHAQTAFERERRGRLPVAGGAESRCDERIGRLCYWDNNDDAPLPPERPAIARARAGLLDVLDRAAAADPADDWVAGQRIRYLVEARRLDDAVAAAADCAGTGWWCAALRGVAAHERGDLPEAAAAFDAALAAMPDAQRCRWTDVSLWLEGRAVDQYRRLPCGPGRDAWERRLWRIAQPLLMLPGNDLRDELLARRVMATVHAQGATPHAMTWGDDMTESEVRYGWPTSWGAQPARPGELGPPSAVGHEPTPSYAFVPRDGALAAPTRAGAADWDLRPHRPRTRYAPRYARGGFATLPHQLARFRRGDSTLVVGAWDLALVRQWDSAATRADSARPAVPDSARTVHAGLVLADDSGRAVRAVATGLGPRGAIAATVADLPRLASLEALDTARLRAARARYALPPLAADPPLSDLLLLARGVDDGADLATLLERASGSTVVRAGGVMGLYWECYLPATPQAPLTVSVRATRLDTRWQERARSALGIGRRVTPVAVRFADVGRPDGRPGRSLTLSWPSVPPGDYRLEVAVARGEESAATAQVVRVERP